MSSLPSITATTASTKTTANALLYIGGFLAVFLIVIVSFMVYGYIYARSRKEEIQKDWPSYRCKPHIIPIAGWIGPPNITTAGNFKDCMENMVGDFLYQALTPVFAIFQSILLMITGLKNSMQQMRYAIYSLRENMRVVAVNLFRKLKQLYKIVNRLTKKITQIFFYIFLMFRNALYALKYVFYMVMSLWNGPIGRLMKFFCFSPEQHIPVYSNIHKKYIPTQIQNICIGSIINPSKPTFVFATIKIYSPYSNIQWYSSVDGWTTNGHHPIWNHEKKQWVHANLPVETETKTSQYMNCLWSGTGLIQGCNKNQWAMDFWGPLDAEELRAYYHTMYSIICPQYIVEKWISQWNENDVIGCMAGFIPDTAMIELDNHEWIPATEVETGMVLHKGGIVIAQIEIMPSITQWYQSPWGLITTHGAWIQYSPYWETIPVDKKRPADIPKRAFQWTTTNGGFYVRMYGEVQWIRSWTGILNDVNEEKHEKMVLQKLPILESNKEEEFKYFTSASSLLTSCSLCS